MHPRVLAAAIAIVCVIPAAGYAQMMPLQDDPAQQFRFRITPYIGHMPAITREETWIHNDGGGQNTFVDVEYRLSSGTAVGLDAEMVVRGPWNALAGVVYASRGESEFTEVSTGENFEINGSRFLIGRIGASYTLREKESELLLRRLSATVHAAPFYMREMPRAEVGFEESDVFDGSNHFGLNIGVSGELPFATDRVAVQLGLEDYATLWNEDVLARLPAEFFGDPDGSATSVEAGVSHVWLFRAGLSIRLR